MAKKKKSNEEPDDLLESIIIGEPFSYWCEDETSSNVDKKPLSREELVARLKAIAADESPRIERMGAMCYDMSLGEEEHTECDICGCDITYLDSFNSLGTIYDSVWKIRSLGYDAKVENVCHECGEKLRKEIYPNSKSYGEEGFDRDKDIWIGALNHVFYFRLSPDEEYHRAIANDKYNYKALLALLQNKPLYTDYFDKGHYIADEIETLEFMTGIKFNE
ncbi:MAG: hypothetical protein HUJ98_07655 [Bacteroidaceae bacterium]|nr:hypothetical protein [Bacteroidaceae bacterium]